MESIFHWSARALWSAPGRHKKHTLRRTGKCHFTTARLRHLQIKNQKSARWRFHCIHCYLEAVYALAHTLLAYTTILCCVNAGKKGLLCPFPPLGETLNRLLNTYREKKNNLTSKVIQPSRPVAQSVQAMPSPLKTPPTLH